MKAPLFFFGLLICLSVWAEDQSPWGTAYPPKENLAPADQARDTKSLIEAIQHMDLKAPDAIEKLKQMGMQRTEVQSAMQGYETARSKDQFFDNFKNLDGSVYEKIKQGSDIEKYFLTALANGGPLATLENYFMSFILDSNGLTQEAAYYFNKAEFMKHLSRTRTFSDLSRPLQFELAPLFDHLGMPYYTAQQLHTVRFLDDETFNTEQFATENGLDSASRHFSAGGFWQYDTNVFGLPDPATPSTLDIKPSGTATIGFANLGIQTSPARPLNAGADLYTFISHHTRDDQRAFDTWSTIPSAWLSLWNSTNNEIRLRYDYGFTMQNRGGYDVQSRIHGPQGAWSHLWSKRYQSEISYSYEKIQYADGATTPSAQLNGPEHDLALKISYPGANNSTQPFARYRLTHSWPLADDFQTNAHLLELGTAYLIGRNTILNLATGYTFVLYPHNGAGRQDRLRLIRFTGSFQPAKCITLFLDATFASNESSIPQSFSYNRWKVVLGPVFGLNF